MTSAHTFAVFNTVGATYSAPFISAFHGALITACPVLVKGTTTDAIPHTASKF
jgi:hypothetical protein